MTKTTEQKFKLHANFWFEISIQDLRDLFCTMGQGSGYWAHSVTVGDIEEDEHELQVRDVIKAIENIVSGKTNLNTYDCGQVFEAFKDKDLGLIDASIADSILQITTYNTLVYG